MRSHGSTAEVEKLTRRELRGLGWDAWTVGLWFIHCAPWEPDTERAASFFAVARLYCERIDFAKRSPATETVL